jgi:hypothetical protein
MSQHPDLIYIIRHAEKPVEPPLSGVDFEGSQNGHSLLPRGWQRSGALVALFDPATGPLQAGLRTPTALISPTWGSHGKTDKHRAYQTIMGLSDRLGLPIDSPFPEEQEPKLAASVVSDYPGVVLICWEHSRIPELASALPVTDASAIPQKWPSHRFDVIWTFTLVPGSEPAQYVFGQIPQQLLSGDDATVIPV